MSTRPYGLICPITKACELLEPRWTIPILTEIWSGSSRFTEIRRGVGNISSALLSKRLKEMQENGLIERIENHTTGTVVYVRTEMSMELEPALNALAVWAQRQIRAELALCSTNLPALMWKLRRSLNVNALPSRRVVISFHFSDPNLDYDTYWILARPGTDIELCTATPNFEVDLFVETSAASLGSILSARSSVSREVELERLYLSGNARLARNMNRWLPKSEFADVADIALA